MGIIVDKKHAQSWIQTLEGSLLREEKMAYEEEKGDEEQMQRPLKKSFDVSGEQLLCASRNLPQEACVRVTYQGMFFSLLRAGARRKEADAHADMVIEVKDSDDSSDSDSSSASSASSDSGSSADSSDTDPRPGPSSKRQRATEEHQVNGLMPCQVLFQNPCC